VAKIGYARVSSRDQDHSTQESRLRATGCEIVRAEKVSGKSRDGRDELAAILQFIRPGDELCVVKLDRLGRSTRDVLNLVHELEQKGAGLRVLEPEFCTSGDTGRIMVTVLGMVAEMERKFILDRQRAGIEAAKARGDVYKGRKPSVPVEEARTLHGEGKPAPSVTERSADPDVRAQIASEFYTTLEQLSADPELLAVVGSWRDTLNHDEILEHLRSFNRTGKVLHRPQ
jgi:DNA invertase Pin-like site-specific DNA recombinase